MLEHLDQSKLPLSFSSIGKKKNSFSLDSSAHVTLFFLLESFISVIEASSVQEEDSITDEHEFNSSSYSSSSYNVDFKSCNSFIHAHELDFWRANAKVLFITITIMLRISFKYRVKGYYCQSQDLQPLLQQMKVLLLHQLLTCPCKTEE